MGIKSTARADSGGVTLDALPQTAELSRLSRGWGRLVLKAGREDVLATVRTAVLLARTLGTSLRLSVFDSASPEIHFGHARCSVLVLGLTDWVKQRLAEISPGSMAIFGVECDFSDLPAIKIQIRCANSSDKQ